MLGMRSTAIGVECARIVAVSGIGEDSVDMAAQLVGVCQDMAEEE